MCEIISYGQARRRRMGTTEAARNRGGEDESQSISLLIPQYFNIMCEDTFYIVFNVLKGGFYSQSIKLCLLYLNRKYV